MLPMYIITPVPPKGVLINHNWFLKFNGVESHFYTLYVERGLPNSADQDSQLHIHSKLHFHHKCSVVPRSNNDFCSSLFTINA